MRIVLLLSLIFHFIFSVSQNRIAIVTTKTNQTAYCDLEGKITYVENTDPIVNEAICKFKNGFGRTRRGGKFFFIDEFGKPIFKTAFEKAEDFKENFAEVKLDGKWGFINRKGELVIKPQFYETHPFSGGLSQVALGANEKHGYIDTSGNFIIKPQFDNGSPFVDNKAWVLLDGKRGLIDRSGNFVIKPAYNEVKDLNEGYTWVKKDGIWGLIDSLGNYLLKPDERNPLIYASNVTFKSFSEFHNGLIRYQLRELYGYKDTQLKVIIPAKFDKATDFKNGLACVKQDDYWGVIDTVGKSIIPINFKEIILNGDDVILVKDDHGNWGYLNLKNEWILKPQFKKATPFEITNYH